MAALSAADAHTKKDPRYGKYFQEYSNKKTSLARRAAIDAQWHFSGGAAPTAPAPIVNSDGTIDQGQFNTQKPAVVGASPEDVKAARDAAYNYTTQHYAADKARDTENAQQDLANRGIPYTPGDEKSQYGQVIGGINRDYQAKYDQANNLAIGQGNAILGTEAQASQGAFDSFLSGLKLMSDADLQKLGIDRQTLIAKLNAKTQSDIAQRRGGGGAPADTGDIVGGVAPGFNVGGG